MCLNAYLLTYKRPLRAYVLTCKRAILNNINSYIIQIYQLYLGFKKENIREILLLKWNSKFGYFKNFTFDQQFETQAY